MLDETSDKSQKGDFILAQFSYAAARVKPLSSALHVIALAVLIGVVLKVNSVEQVAAKTSVQLEVIQQQVDGITRDVASLKSESR